MKLYEINNELEEMLQPNTSGELDIDVDKLDKLYKDKEDKIVNIISLYKNYMGDAKKFDDEIANLAKRKKSIENRAKWLKDYLANCVSEKGSYGVHSIGYRQSTKLNVTDYDALPEKYRTIEVVSTPKTYTTLLKDDLAKGVAVEGARLDVFQNIQIK